VTEIDLYLNNSLGPSNLGINMNLVVMRWGEEVGKSCTHWHENVQSYRSVFGDEVIQIARYSLLTIKWLLYF
jgi:hypothetical protein